MGKTLVVIGLVISGLGLLMMLGVPFFRLPGDFYVKRGIEERKVDISRYVDYSLINRALDQLGRV